MTRDRWAVTAVAGVAVAVAVTFPGAASAVTWQPAGPGIPDSPTDSWALRANLYGTTALHWDNGTTTDFSLPVHTNASDIGADSPADAWAVGGRLSKGGLGGNYQPIMVHLNGSSATPYFVSNDGASESLASVAVIGPADAWAAGPGVLVHWDGAQWTRVAAPTPNGAAGPLAISSVSASGSDLWALGSTSVHGSQTYYAARWDGTSWSITPALPAIPGFVRFTGISAASAAGAWVGGEATGGGFAMDYNGSAWSTFWMPGAETQVNWVAARGNQAWAVGSAVLSSANPSQAAVWAWNGSAWSSVPFPVTTAYSSATRVSYVPGSSTIWVNTSGGTFADG